MTLKPDHYEDDSEQARENRIMNRVGMIVAAICVAGLGLAVHQYTLHPTLSLVVGGLCAFILFQMALALIK